MTYTFPDPAAGRPTQVVAASGAAVTIPDVATASLVDVTLTANCTLTFPSAGTGGRSFTLVLRQDAAGSRLVTWPANVKWAGGTVPTLSTTPTAGRDILTFTTADGTEWVGSSGAGAGGGGGGGIPLSTVTAAGDLIVGTGAGAVGRVGIGTTGQVATVAGGTVTWANPASGFTNPMTTAGDIIIENATPAPARLPIGTTAQVLTVVAGLPAWVAPQVTAVDCILNAAGVVLTSGSLAAVAFPTTVDDPFNMHSNTVNNSRITVPAAQAGVYMCVAAFNVTTPATASAGRFLIDIFKNGAASGFTAELGSPATATSNFPALNCTGILRLAVGDFVELDVLQTSGGSVTGTAQLMLVKLGL